MKKFEIYSKRLIIIWILIEIGLQISILHIFIFFHDYRHTFMVISLDAYI